MQSCEGVAIAEFAVSLPLLLVLVVGVFDFGNAFNVKQKIGGAAREGARFASSMPTTDLHNGNPPQSVDAIRNTVDSYLKAADVNDCGLSTAAGSHDDNPALPDPTTALRWQYTAAGTGALRAAL